MLGQITAKPVQGAYGSPKSAHPLLQQPSKAVCIMSRLLLFGC